MNDYIKELKKAIAGLDSASVKYAITRNYHFIAEDRPYEGGDIDICVEKKDEKKIKRIMKSLNFKIHPINPFSNHLGYIKFIPKEKKVLFLHFHIGGVTGINLRYLKSKHILDNREKQGFFYRTCKDDEFLVVLLHSILDKKMIGERYEKEIRRLLSEKPDMNYIKANLCGLLGEQNANEVMRLLEKRDFRTLEKNSARLKKEFIRRYPGKMIALARLYILGALWKLLWLLKSKPLISFIGMDGSGKTTTTELLMEIFRKNNIKAERVYTGRGRYNILPIQLAGQTYKRLNEKKKKTAPEETEEKKGGYSTLQTLAAPVFALDLLLRYIFKILPLRKTRHFVITDRYSTDILLMKGVPRWLKRALFSLFPKPTLTFYLYNDPKVLAKRKNHDIKDLYRQEKIFKEINRIIKPTEVKSEAIETAIEAVLHSL